MINLQIPVDGTSVAVGDFAAAAKVALDAIPAVVSDAEKAQAKDAIAAAAMLVKAGHVGSGNVFVTIGGIGQSEQLAPGVGAAIVSITVSQRPAAAKPIAALPAIAPTAPVSPYDTGAKPEEVAREAANRGALGLPGATLEQAAADLGAPVPAIVGAGVAVPSTQASTATNKPLKGKALAAATAKGKAAAKPAGVLAATKAGAVVSPYDAGSVKASDVQSTGTPSEGSSKAAAPARVAGRFTKAAAPAAAKSGAGSPSQPTLATSTTKAAAPAAAGADKAPQTNPQTAKPAAGAMGHQVAKDRAGK